MAAGGPKAKAVYLGRMGYVRPIFSSSPTYFRSIHPRQAVSSERSIGQLEMDVERRRQKFHVNIYIYIYHIQCKKHHLHFPHCIFREKAGYHSYHVICVTYM